jgi:hypothetical protein
LWTKQLLNQQNNFWTKAQLNDDQLLNQQNSFWTNKTAYASEQQRMLLNSFWNLNLNWTQTAQHLLKHASDNASETLMVLNLLLKNTASETKELLMKKQLLNQRKQLLNQCFWWVTASEGRFWWVIPIASDKHFWWVIPNSFWQTLLMSDTNSFWKMLLNQTEKNKRHRFPPVAKDELTSIENRYNELTTIKNG